MDNGAGGERMRRGNIVRSGSGCETVMYVCVCDLWSVYCTYLGVCVCVRVWCLVPPCV